ncbi:MAG: amidohydrolase family protein [Opitutaceae bacterium]
MNRREFLASSTAAALASRATSLAAAKSAPVPAIDTHTHFYDSTREQGVPWPPKTEEILYRPHLPAEFRGISADLNVLGTVVVEASEWVADNNWILNLAKTNPGIVAFVGHLVPGRPEFPGNLQRLAADPLFRGLRMRAGYLKNLGDPGVAADLKRVADLDLSIDMLGGAAILEPTLALSRLLPGLRIVINHVPFADWDANPTAMRAAFAELARRPNVFAKISNVARRLNGAPINDPAHYRPALDTLCELFGPDRIVYGSNWPVSNRIAPYALVHQIVADYFATKDRATAEKYFWRNSHVAYRWLPRGAAAALKP